MEFTYKAYVELIKQIAKKEYTFISYHDALSERENVCILRHDVDFDLDRALEMARLEASIRLYEDLPHGVRSTYFVLLNTNFYNLFATRNRKILDEILALGHEIGLHFDETQYPSGGG